MKLSTFFAQIDMLWKSTSLFQLGVWLVFVGVVTYSSYQFAARQYSSPKVYLIFSVAFVLVIGVLESALSVSTALANPVAVALLAGCAGTGSNAYYRLCV